MENQKYSEEVPFFWRWIYPLLLTAVWGGLIGIVISFLQDDTYVSFFEKLFGGFVGGAIIAIVLFIMYETPFNIVIQLIAKIPYAGLIFILPWLMYWIFVWPIGLVDKIIALVIKLKYSATLTNKSWR